MQVVLKVWSSHPDYCAGCEYATVEVSPEFAKLALRRINVLREQKGRDPSLNETYYWDSSAQYFSPWVDRTSESDEGQGLVVGLEETLEELEIDTLEIVAAPAEFCVLESQFANVECAQMIVREDGIGFTAIAKHSDMYLTTAEIAKQVLESIRTTGAS